MPPPRRRFWAGIPRRPPEPGRCSSDATDDAELTDSPVASQRRQISEGGFGQVYRGVREDAAVKRLKRSRRGERD